MSIKFYSVDTIGHLRAEKARVDAKLKKLEDQLKERGAGVYEGNLFRATVSVSDRPVTAWKKIAKKLDASRQLIRAHTRHTEVRSVNVRAKVKEAA